MSQVLKMNEKENPLNVTLKLNCESFIVLPITHPYKCTLHSKPPEAKQLQLVRYRIHYTFTWCELMHKIFILTKEKLFCRI